MDAEQSEAVGPHVHLAAVTDDSSLRHGHELYVSACSTCHTASMFGRRTARAWLLAYVVVSLVNIARTV